MAKRSRKRSARSRKDDAGCMWGLISLFDFRQGQSPRKLLADRKRGSGRYGCSKKKLELVDSYKEKLDHINWHDSQVFEDSNESGSGMVDLTLARIKELIEEEISQAQPTKKFPFDEIKRLQSNLELEDDKTHENPSNDSKVVSEALVNDFKVSGSLDSLQYHYPNQSEGSCSLDLAAFMLELYSDKHQCRQKHADSKTQIDSCGTSLQEIGPMKHECINGPDFQLPQKHTLLLKALSDVAEAFLSQKFTDGTQVKGKRAFDQSKEFMEALEVLNSNRELFIKLLQDPNSVLLKYIHELQSGKLSKSKPHTCLEGTALLDETSNSGEVDESANQEVINKQNGRGFSRKKDKLTGTKPSKGNESSASLNRIVILKPAPARLQNPSDATGPSSSPHSFKSQDDSERAVSLFSVKQLKRRFRNLIGDSKKEQHLISMDGVLHKIPCGSKDLGEVGKQVTRENARDGLALQTCDKGKNSSLVLAKKRYNKAEAKEFQPNINTESEGPKAGKYERLKISIVVNRNDSSLYEEAKKHLAEMLDTGDRKDIFPNGHTKTLGRLLSMPEYDLISPKFVPGGNKAIEMSPRQIIFSPRLQLKLENATSISSPSRQNSEVSPCADSNQDDDSPMLQLKPENPTCSSSPSWLKVEDLPSTNCNHYDESQVSGSNPAVLEFQVQESSCTGEDTNLKGSMQITELVDNICMGERTKLEVLSETNAEPSAIAERCNGERSVETSESGLATNISQLETPSVSPKPSSLIVTNTEAPESIMEKYERPSPVSVLEPLFSEDILSPERQSVVQTELPVQPRQLIFEDCESSHVVSHLPVFETNRATSVEDKKAKFEYVRTVLEASELNPVEIAEGWQSLQQSLDPSLFDEVGISHHQLLDDPKLLFDCIGEVLMEVHDKFVITSPWLSFVKPNARCVPKGEAFVQEVLKGIDWYFQVKFPTSLDQIVGKDLRSGTWLDLRFETENIVVEVEDYILDEIMEETLVEWWISSLSL